MPIAGLVARERPTLRQLLQRLAGARGHFCMAGTPEQVADTMEDWFRAGPTDGFNLMPLVLPAMLDVFVAEVVPILQRRGLFRTEYVGPMLRDQYGLPQPVRQSPGGAAQQDPGACEAGGLKPAAGAFRRAGADA